MFRWIDWLSWRNESFRPNSVIRTFWRFGSLNVYKNSIILTFDQFWPALSLLCLPKYEISKIRFWLVKAPKNFRGGKSDFLQPVVIKMKHTIRRSTRNFVTHRISQMTSSYDSYFANFRSRGLTLPALKIWIASLIQEIRCRCPFVSI